MSKLSLHNKLFLLFFALLVVLIIVKAPHEETGKSNEPTPVETVSE